MSAKTSEVYFVFIKFERDLHGIERKEEWMSESWCAAGVWESLKSACLAHKSGGQREFDYHSGPIKLLRYEKYPAWPNMLEFKDMQDCRENFMTEERILTQRDMQRVSRSVE